MFFHLFMVNGTPVIVKSEGLTPAEQERARQDPTFVREFQGDKFGREYK